MGGGRRSHKRRRAEHAPGAERAAEGEAAEEERPAYLRPGESEQGRAFEAYYRAQRILPPGSNDDEAAWAAFFAQLRRPLPVTFRLNESAHLSGLCREAMAAGARLLEPAAAGAPQPCDESGRPLKSALQLGWCNGWQLGCSAGVLKRPLHAHWAELNDWLTRWASLGVVSRQAIDSMAPVAFLAAAPHHRVLDLCASPGSKTQQLLDGMHADPRTPSTGFVVANDFSPFRARALVRRCAALGHAAARVAVVSHAAQRFPDVGGRAVACGEGEYDRVTCDVPCCGDGTLRKNPEALHHWRPSFGQRLHGLQLSIALRGLALLKVGGELAYSTCAFNPIEGEAVVAELLRRTRGAVELLDVSGRLPLLRRRAGLTSWRVIDDEGREWPSHAALLRARLPQRVRRRFHASMWPPAEGSGQPQLQRCVRLLPGLSESGGFFVALLRKVRPWPPPPPPAVPRALPPAAQPHGLGRRPYCAAPTAVLQLLRASLGIHVPPGGLLLGGGGGAAAPVLLHCRSAAWADGAAGGGASRVRVVAISAELRAHLSARPGGQEGQAPGLRVIRCGFNFGHSTRSGAFRLTHAGAEAALAASRAAGNAGAAEGAPLRIAALCRADMLELLRLAAAQPTAASAAMARAGGARSAAAAALTPLGQLSAAAQGALRALGVGACVLVCAAAGAAAPRPPGQPAASKRARGSTRDSAERQAQQREERPRDDGDGGAGEVVVPAFIAALPRALPSARDEPGAGAPALGVRVALTHEPGLENLPRAFAAHTVAQLTRGDAGAGAGVA